MHAHRFQAELELAFRDARDVEEIVDQPRFQFDVATDHFESPAHVGRIRSARFQLAHHRDHGGKRVAQFVREQCEKLIFGGVRANQFLPQSDVARLVFHEIKHALNGLFRALEPEQIHIHEPGHPVLIGEGLLDQLKGRAESEHFLDRINRSDLHFIVAGVVNVLFRG